MTDKGYDVWETFDALYKSVNRQGRRVEELEARIVELERRLAARSPAESLDWGEHLKRTFSYPCSLEKETP